MIDFFNKYALRSFRQVLIHVSIAIILAILLVFILDSRISIGANSFVSIVSSMAAISGALLAISLALFFFFCRHITDWRDKLTEKLIQGRADLRAQIEKSVQYHPDISRRLAALYDKSMNYMQGQLIDMK